jgi:uncharacterized protein (UPF0276 family)
MAAITERGGCGQLLDLHNLYCNAINHGFDAFAAIDRMDLDRVIEIHVADGRWQDGYWMDTHDGRVPPPVGNFSVIRCRTCAFPAWGREKLGSAGMARSKASIAPG